MAWIAVLGGACRPVEDVSIPTVVILPTTTDTPTPTNTYTPSNTFTPTLTFTPSLTPSNTPTPTHTPTLTFTPSLTPTNTATFTLTPSITPTPTNTLRPTLTPSNTPVPPTPTFTPTDTPFPSFTPVPPTLTPSPIPTATVPQPVIFSFVTGGTNVVSGTPITVTWSANADVARLEIVGQTGAVVQSFPVSISGTQTIAAPANAGRVFSIRLVASRSGIDAIQSATVSVSCPSVWFFGDQFAPQGAGCPTQATSGTAAFQGFERGFMLYIGAPGFNRVYGLQNEGSRYIVVPNGWDGVTINASPPPDGLFIPQGVFNWVYYNTLAPIGTWNSALGWANGNIDQGPRTIQFEGSVGATSPFYIDSPVGAVFRFSGGDSGTWSRVR